MMKVAKPTSPVVAGVVTALVLLSFLLLVLWMVNSSDRPSFGQ